MSLRDVPALPSASDLRAGDFRALFEASPTPFLVIAPPDWIIVAVNDAYLRVTDTTRDRQIGRKLFDVFPNDPDDPDADGVQQLAASLERVVATRASDVMAVQRYAVRNAAGCFVERWWSPLNSPVLDEKGDVSLIIHRVEEITEAIRLRGEAEARDQLASDQQAVIDRLHASEAALRESEARYRTLFETVEAERNAERDLMWETSPDLMLVIDFDGVFRRVNPAWTKVLGYGPEELVGCHVNDFVVPDDHDETTKAYELSAAGGHPTIVNRYRHKDGSIRWMSWTAAPAGGLTYATGRDITLEKEREAQLAHAQEALRQSQKMEAMGSLTGGVAHDFNNLLTPIIGSLDLLQRKRLGGEREQRQIAGAIQSAERAKTLVQRLLAFARRQPLQPKPVDLAMLVSSMAGLIASTTGPQIKVLVDVARDLPAAVVDANQIEMAILNLSVNARDAMGSGGTLRISATAETIEEGHRLRLQPGRYIRLSVADTGAGMDAETLSKAVEPFFSTKGIGRGTGLGLSMVHGLALQLGGSLTIESEPGLGTNVEIWLPASTALAADQPALLDSGAIAAAAGTVLLVDDEELVRTSIADMLAELGYGVVEAGSAEEALQLVEDGLLFDLLVTDHMMPGMSGTDLARTIRGRTPGMPVMLVSGYAEVEGIAPDLPRLLKPFRQAELAVKIGELDDAVAS